jgi:hypothetical protein
MTLNYSQVWEKMNSLEMVTSKVCSAREILDSAIDALENHNREKAEALMYAADEFLKYYLADFDEKFKDAWKETVVKLKQEQLFFDGWTQDTPKVCDNDDTTPECKSSWNSFWEENYYPDEYKGSTVSSVSDNMPPWGHSDMEALSQQKEDKVVKWQLPVEMDGPSGECFITFPDDLLEAAGLEEGDDVEWVEQQEVGSFILRKVTKPFGMDEC